ncbi:MAG: hypothetical protein UY04_C0013G0015 [Parcubacteria group bacterium GW2011_GWA2_47_7]|nr:MAG: hypothetical protein UY04_C0013G0015 [Parcubacteria group bacterium GW2011_GWA2_47_7]
MSYHEELSSSESVKKLPEGSKAEKIRNGVEMRLEEITSAIAAGHPSLTRLELTEVGKNIIALFDELLDELPEDFANEHPTIEHSAPADELENGPVAIGDNRSKRFWEIDNEIGVLLKKFDALYETQAFEPEIQTDGIVVQQDKPLMH